MKILPNLITAVRFALTPVIVLAILRGEWNLAFWISIAAGITDVLDGLAARRLHVSSRIGSYLDPIADKLLLTLIYLAFGIALAIPWWMVALVLWPRPVHLGDGRLRIFLHHGPRFSAHGLGQAQHLRADHRGARGDEQSRRIEHSRRAVPLDDGRDDRVERNPLRLAGIENAARRPRRGALINRLSYF